LRVAGILLIVIRDRVVDRPKLLDLVLQFFLIVVGFLDELVELRRLFIGARLGLLGPILLGVGYAVSLG